MPGVGGGGSGPGGLFGQPSRAAFSGSRSASRASGHSGPGRSLRRAAYERTQKRTRAAGLRRAKLRPAAASDRSRKFNIQNPELRIRGAACGAHASSATNCGPPLPPGCVPPMPAASLEGSPAAERTGLRRKGAALRPGGGGCGLPVAPRPNLTQGSLQRTATTARRSLRDRFIPNSGSCLQNGPETSRYSQWQPSASSASRTRCRSSARNFR